MDFLGKLRKKDTVPPGRGHGQGEGATPAKAPSGAKTPAGTTTTKQAGDAAEDRALAHLQAAGLRLATRNYRTPGRGGGEIDLVMRDRDGTLVFVEVRQRAGTSHGGAAASIGAAKQRRIVFAARHYLLRLGAPPPCRFDVVLVEQGEVRWLKAAFDAQGW